MTLSNSADAWYELSFSLEIDLWLGINSLHCTIDKNNLQHTHRLDRTDTLIIT